MIIKSDRATNPAITNIITEIIFFFDNLFVLSDRLSERLKPVKPHWGFFYLLLMVLHPTNSFSVELAETWFERGVEAYLWNDTQTTIECFKKSLEIDPQSAKYSFYLALSYHKAGEYEKAVENYEKSIANGGLTPRILLNRGNLKWSMGDFDSALADYNQVIEGGGKLAAKAYLNRANLMLQQGKIDGVVEDYTAYLNLETQAPDRENIERIIAMIQARVEATQIEEERKMAEAIRQAEDQAKRDAMMDDLLDSLNDSSKDTKSKMAGFEKIFEELEESELEE